MNYAQIAAAVYQACNHFDPYLPKLSVEMAQAWGRLFEKHRLTVGDLMAAVDKVYDEHGSGYRPLPKDLCDAARSIRAERAKSEVVDEIRALGPAKASAEVRRRAIEEFAQSRKGAEA